MEQVALIDQFTVHWSIKGTSHNLPYKLKKFMSIALVVLIELSWTFFSIQPPIKRPRRRLSSTGRHHTTESIVDSLRRSNFWPTSAPNEFLGITAGKFENGIQSTLSTLENPNPKQSQVEEMSREDGLLSEELT